MDDGMSEEKDQEDVKDYFAKALFKELSDEEKIDLKSFERLKSGVQSKGASDLKSGTPVIKDNNFETLLIDNRLDREKLEVDLPFLSVSYNGTFVSKSDIGKEISSKKYDLQKGFVLNEEDYKIVYARDLSSFEERSFATEIEAQQFYHTTIENQPELEGAIQVMALEDLEF